MKVNLVEETRYATNSVCGVLLKTITTEYRWNDLDDLTYIIENFSYLELCFFSFLQSKGHWHFDNP